MNLSSLAQLYEAMRVDLESRVETSKHHIENFDSMRKECLDSLDKRIVEDKAYINKLFDFLTGIQETNIKELYIQMGAEVKDG